MREREREREREKERKSNNLFHVEKYVQIVIDENKKS